MFSGLVPNLADLVLGGLGNDSDQERQPPQSTTKRNTFTPRIGGSLYSCNERNPNLYQDLDNHNYVDMYRTETQNLLKEAYRCSQRQQQFNQDDIDYSKLPFNYIDPNRIDNDEINLLDKYNCDHRYDPNLSISSKRDEIIRSIEFNDVCIIQANTGSGKTTQVPQMILDAYARENKYCNIIVTQPRRVAAMSVSYRVCNERKWEMGTYCAYHIGLDSKNVSKYSRLVYATTGILLQKLMSTDFCPNQYTHIIIDEIHERDLDTDLALLLIKVLKLKNLKAKIIMMSATCDEKLFKDYFSKIEINNRRLQVGVNKYPERMFDVRTFYLDTIGTFLRQPVEIDLLKEFEIDKPHLQEGLHKVLKLLLLKFDEYEKMNQETDLYGLPIHRGSVLVFLPGMYDIRSIEDYLKRSEDLINLKILPLHSEISTDQQLQVFLTPQPGERKVILSTTIAESSITVKDIKYVVDFCLTKKLQCDDYSYYTTLDVDWGTKSNLDQRKGRAGRVSNGLCFRFITKEFYNQLPEYQEAEIKRVPLDRYILQLKRFNFGIDIEPLKLISMAIEQPTRGQIEMAILNLKMAGALTVYKNHINDPNDGVLTYCGEMMSALPLDVKLVKLIFIGHVFGKLRECLILAAALSQKSIFVHMHNSNLEFYRNKLYFAHGSFCDYTAIINAYNYWRVQENRKIFRTREEREEWAHSNMLEISRLFDVYNLKKKLERRLEEFHIISRKDLNDEQIIMHQLKDMHIEDDLIQQNNILKIIIAAAFYPNFFKLKKLNEDACLELVNQDHRSTVLVKGFDNGDGLFYHKLIQNRINEFVQCASQTRVQDMNCFIQFKGRHEKLYTTTVHPGVYLAMAIHLFKIPLFIPSVSFDNISGYRRRIGELKARGPTLVNFANVFVDDTNEHKTSLNRLFKSRNKFEIILIETIECGHFIAQINEEEYTDQLLDIHCKLNDHRTVLHPIHRADMYVGQLVCAPFLDTDEFKYDIYRAKILALKNDCVQVLFVDYGNKLEVDYVSIFKLRQDLVDEPYKAFECKLINIQPPKTQTYSKWSNNANTVFNKMLFQEGTYEIEVFSIVDDIARVTLYNPSKGNVGEILTRRSIAEYCEEPYASTFNRTARQIQTGAEHAIYNKLSDYEEILSTIEYDQHREFQIHGPENPLVVGIMPIKYADYHAIRRNAFISHDSVNFVLLDDDPSSKIERFIVSDSVTAIQRRDKTVLSSTLEAKLSLKRSCLMPRIAGILPIVCIMFAPVIELRAAESKTHYSSVLCGLGFDITNEFIRPLFKDNDIECPLDVQIDESDINAINALRASISMMDGKEQAEMWSKDPKRLETIQKINQNNLLSILNKERLIIEPDQYSYRYNFQWNKIAEDNFRDHRDTKESYFNAHRIVRLNK